MSQDRFVTGLFYTCNIWVIKIYHIGLDLLRRFAHADRNRSSLLRSEINISKFFKYSILKGFMRFILYIIFSKNNYVLLTRILCVKHFFKLLYLHVLSFQKIIFYWPFWSIIQRAFAGLQGHRYIHMYILTFYYGIL